MGKKIVRPIGKTCRDCVNASDFHSPNLKGEPILCKCRFHKFSKFLNRDWCEHFMEK